ncbi:MAG: TerB family tellurite resistance protein [Thermoanaerobaculia bacterium]
MSILKQLLGLGAEPEKKEAKQAGDTETVRKIVAELEALEPERARYLAAFAYILGRVAHADLDISAEETRKMEEIVQGFGHLPAEQAILIVQIAKSQNRLLGGTENFLVTREFKQISTPEKRHELLDCLFAVSAADESISAAEEAQVRQIASELGLSHGDYVQARSAYSRHREVLKPLARPSGGD